MSLFSYPFGRESGLFKRLTDTNNTIVVTAGNNGGTVLALRASEINGSTPTLVLEVIDDSSTVVSQICNLRAFTAREVWEVARADGVPIVLPPGYALRAKASAANQIDISGVYVDPPQL
jgi:hypothetical protein